jgi:uncharacterized protein YhaN
VRIKRLFIKDFGIFHNELIEDIAPGLVVIGGHNRAGKTTFMELLRYLPFGFPRKKKFILARNRHEVEATISLSDNEEANLYLQGYSAPLIKGSKEIASTSELFYQMDPFTYQQLFTISLDELQYYRFNNNEKDKLHSILLGAGLKEFILAPQLEEFFYKEAEKIGGKQGDPKVKEFKPYYLMIRDGMKLQAEASRQVERFHEKQLELKSTEDNIRENEEEKEILEDELYRLDILKNNYHLYAEIVEIKNRLTKDEVSRYLQENINFYPERAKDLLDRFNKKKEEIKELSQRIREKYGAEISKDLVERISRHKMDIEQLKEKVAGLKEKVNFYFEKEARLEREEKDLKNSLLTINQDWQGGLEEIAAIQVDQIELEVLQQKIEKYNKVSSNLDREKSNLQEYQERKDYLEKAIEGIQVNKPFKMLNIYFLGSFIFILAGFLLARLNIYFTLFSLVGVLGLGIYSLYKYTTEKNYLLYEEKSKIEIHNLDLRISSREEKIKDYMESLEPLEEEFNEYRKMLGLNRNASPEFIREYYKELQGLKAKANQLKTEKNELAQDFITLEEELKKIVDLINIFPELLSAQIIDQDLDLHLQDQQIFVAVKDLYEFKDNIMALLVLDRENREIDFEVKELLTSAGMEYREESGDPGMVLEEYLQDCEKYLQYSRLQERMELLRGQIQVVLNTEAARKAMDSLKIEVGQGIKEPGESAELYHKFIYLYNQFSSLDIVEETYNLRKLKLAQLEEILDKEKKDLISIQRELAELATDEALKKASQLIDEGRKDLSILAEEYAVRKTAAFILRKVREIFIQETRDKLLAGASKYFREITRGEYKAILPKDNIMESDFQAILKDGTIQESIDLLSRGTLEQLFLAIRISRIKEIEPALPVIIDDSFVNFDNFHLTESLALIKELASTHQVFLLTCHSHLVDSCLEDIPIQFWKLERGRFSRSNREDLVEYLSLE